MPRKQKSKQGLDMSAKIAIIVAVIGLVGTLGGAYFNYRANLDPILLANTQVANVVPSTATAIPGKVFEDHFDNNNNVGWYTGNDSYDHYNRLIAITNEMLQRTMESNDEIRSEYFNTTEIPNIADRKNFCLIFDARVSDYVGQPVIVILARSNNYNEASSGHYYIGLENGGGTVWINPENGSTSQIGVFDNGISWGDMKTHTVKISLQDNVLEVYEEQTNILLYQKIFEGNELILNDGQIRMGTELLGPNQKVVVEFDNIFVYDKCP